MSKEPPRGIRNNNPLNIRRSSARWTGLIEPGTDKALTSGRLSSGSADSKQASVCTHYDAEFCQFESMKYGFRAAFKLLFSYYNKHGLHDVMSIIKRWAPDEDNNNTKVYGKFVINYMMGAGAYEANTRMIMPKPEEGPYTWKLLVKAMAEMESTKAIRKYFDGNINEAYEAAIKSLKPQT